MPEIVPVFSLKAVKTFTLLRLGNVKDVAEHPVGNRLVGRKKKKELVVRIENS